jgi:Family of unknown function (DUF6510)
MELAFAGVAPVVRADAGPPPRLPAPQRAALRTASGFGPGSAPDRFLVGLAVLSLLADAAQEHPLVCLADDAQWLDQASAQVIGFVARRLAAESAARCPTCDQVLLRLVRGPHHAWLDLRGLDYLQLPMPDEA